MGQHNQFRIVDAKEYYKMSMDWTYDLYLSQTLFLRRTIIALILLTILLFISIVTNLTLFPLKEKVPFLYAFDHATGEITKIGELERTSLSSNWALTRYLLINYVINRESYDAYNLEVPYQKVWAQSSDHVQAQYEEEAKSSNAASPYKLYGKDKYITTKVLSVNQLNDNTVEIKFEKTLHDRIGGNNQIIQKEAIIKWSFTDANTTQKMLDRDPLGFKVNYYQVSQVNLNT